MEGHTHPVIRVRKGSTRLRLPCFVLDENKLTLPSFGAWTGGFEIQQAAHRKIFAIANFDVFEVPSSTALRTYKV